MTCHAGLFDVSINDQKKIGAQAASQIESKAVIVGRNGNTYGNIGGKSVDVIVAEVGNNLVSVLGSNPWNFSFKVIQNKEVNAFALPGGPIYVYTGLLSAFKLESSNPSEGINMLAGVLGHEMIHVTNQHWAKQYKKDQERGLGLAIILGATGASNSVQQVAGILNFVQAQKYSRADEYQADDGSVRLLNQARGFGYDPQGVVDMLQVLDKVSQGTPQSLSWLSDHPSAVDRIKRAEKNVAELPLTGQGTMAPVVWDANAGTVTMAPYYPQGSSTGSITRVNLGTNELTIQGAGGSRTIPMDQSVRITRQQIGRASQVVALSDLGLGDDVRVTQTRNAGNAQTVEATYRSVSGTIKSLSSSRLTLQPNTIYGVASNAVFTDVRGSQIPLSNLRTGQQVTSRLNPTSNEVWEISQGALKTPLITSITHSGTADLRAGDVFKATMTASSGGYAKFDLEGIATGVRMTESATRGTYTRKLTIPNRSLPNQSRVVVTFQSADGKRETRTANELGGSGSTYSTYLFAAPVISSPRDGDEIGNTITVRGRTEPNAKVSIELFYQRRGSTGKQGHKGPIVVTADQYGDFETKPIALKASPSLKNSIDGTLRITATLPDGTQSEEAVVKVVRSARSAQSGGDRAARYLRF